MNAKQRELRLGIPKGRMFDALSRLLTDSSIQLQSTARGYRPQLSFPGFEVKLLKPQAIVKMLQFGSRDLGFAGADWVAEFAADSLVQVLDTGLDPVRVVAAAPPEIAGMSDLKSRPLVVASELERLTLNWIRERGLQATYLRSFGATEVYPPEDADCIVDVAASGATLHANSLSVIDEIMTSSTRLYASAAALENREFRSRIDEFVLILQSVLDARHRVMLEVNVSPDRLEGLVRELPCMREPTIAPLHGNLGFAVKVAAPRAGLPGLINRIKSLGGNDIVVSHISQIVP